jgi:hypothetical protein
MRTIATSQRLRNVLRMTLWKTKPSTPIGIVPMMMSQPIRASGSLRGTLPTSDCAHRPMMRPIVRRKYSSTAVSVPIWVMAVKVAPGSVADGRNSPTMRRCALEEMGRNSVSPWIRPRKIASNTCMGAFQ